MYNKALRSITILFFMMGFITCLNDILIPFLKKVFDLDYTQAAMIQFWFFGAYGLASIPASRVLEKIGYPRGMILGFSVAAIGCLLFYPAVSLHTYGLFLFALFILATGVVILQVAANPYASVLGPKETSSFRLNLVQAFNSFGTFIAPFFGSILILSKLEHSTNADAVKYPYLFIALILVIIAVTLSRLNLPEVKDESSDESTWKNVLKNKNLALGKIGIFTYVGAEVSIGSFLVNYIMEISALPETQAARLISMYWGGAMVGRFLGIYTLRKFSAGKVLATHAVLAIAFILLSVSTTGMFSVYSMILVGLCNSIMFPTIFTLAIKTLKKGEEKKGSGILSTSILGGSLIPVLTGIVADHAGLKLSFLLPMICYVYIAFFGLKNKKSANL